MIGTPARPMMTLSAKLIRNSRTTMVHAPFYGIGLAMAVSPTTEDRRTERQASDFA